MYQSNQNCEIHLEEKNWIELIENTPIHGFDESQFEDIIQTLRSMLNEKPTEPLYENMFDIENSDKIRDCDFKTWIGLNKNDFNDLLLKITIEKCEKPRTALAIYLTKLHTCETFERLAIFSVFVRKLQLNISM